MAIGKQSNSRSRRACLSSSYSTHIITHTCTTGREDIYATLYLLTHLGTTMLTSQQVTVKSSLASPHKCLHSRCIFREGIGNCTLKVGDKLSCSCMGPDRGRDPPTVELTEHQFRLLHFRGSSIGQPKMNCTWNEGYLYVSIKSSEHDIPFGMHDPDLASARHLITNIDILISR